MTGAEMAAGAAAGKLAIDAAKEIGHQHQAVNAQLLESAASTPGFEAAAATYGTRQAVKQQILLNLYRPLARIMGVSRDYFVTDFGVDLTEKIREVPDENLQTPKASVAGPAMEGLAFSLDEPELKDLYLELLARASDDRAASRVHPSFSSVIRALSEAEAQYLPQFIVGGQNRPIVQIQAELQPGSRKLVQRNHVLNLLDGCGQPLADDQLPTYVDNWIRLGLVEVHYDGTLPEILYGWVQDRADIQLELSQVSLTPIGSEWTSIVGKVARGYLAPTAFGAQFAAVVGMAPFVPQPALSPTP